MTQKEYAASHKIVAFIFGDRKRAAAVNEELHDKGFYEAQGAIASTVVEVDDKGKTHVHEHGRGVKGSIIGLAVGEQPFPAGRATPLRRPALHLTTRKAT